MTHDDEIGAKELPAELQFVPRTQRALRVLGELIEEWTLDPTSRPGRRDGDGRMVLDLRAFVTLLRERGLCDTASDSTVADFEVREGVSEIELIERRSDRFSILLPEPHLVEVFRGFPPFTYKIPAVYGTVDYGDVELSRRDDAPAMVDYRIAEYEEDPAPGTEDGREVTRRFLSLHMAGYSCSQCG